MRQSNGEGYQIVIAAIKAGCWQVGEECYLANVEVDPGRGGASDHYKG